MVLLRSPFRLIALSPVLGLLACGPKLGEPVEPTSGQRQANTQLTGTVDQLAQLGTKPENAFAIYGALSVVGPLAADPSAQRSALPTGSPGPQDLSPAGCVTGNAASGYTYNNCTSGGVSINGTVRIAAGRTDIDLAVQASNQGGNVRLKLAGTTTNDGSRLTGDLVYELQIDLGGLGGLAGGAGNIRTQVTYDLSYQRNPVCITAGSVRVDYQTAATHGVALFEYSGCNAYTVRNGS